MATHDADKIDEKPSDRRTMTRDPNATGGPIVESGETDKDGRRVTTAGSTIRLTKPNRKRSNSHRKRTKPGLPCRTSTKSASNQLTGVKVPVTRFEDRGCLRDLAAAFDFGHSSDTVRLRVLGKSHSVR